MYPSVRGTEGNAAAVPLTGPKSKRVLSDRELLRGTELKAFSARTVRIVTWGCRKALT